MWQVVTRDRQVHFATCSLRAALRYAAGFRRRREPCVVVSA